MTLWSKLDKDTRLSILTRGFDSRQSHHLKKDLIMNAYMFLCFSWLSFIPMASLALCVGDSTCSIENIEPGDMFLINEEGDHERYKITEYDHHIS
jgi:hypothetical protein